MEKFLGFQVCSGIGIAPIYVIYENKIQVVESVINNRQIEAEKNRFDTAVLNAKEEYQRMALDTEEVVDKEADSMSKELIEVYIMLLDDPEFQHNVKKLIDNYLINAESAVKKVIQNYTSILSNPAKDEYFVERIRDLEEIGMRILNYLGNRKQKMNIAIDKDCVLVANNLFTSQFLSMAKQKLKGIVLEEGGSTSHVAIMAKAYGIPMIIGVKSILQSSENGTMAILDASNSTVIIDPDEHTIAVYEKKLQQEKDITRSLLKVVEKRKHESPDGVKISVNLNLDVIEELDLSVSYLADGIGLFRSEFVLSKLVDTHDNEYQQFKIYKSLLDVMKGKEVTIRTFDAGGDKLPISISQVNEENPLLGHRGIRYCLDARDFFCTQLRALLKASNYGRLRILIPMVSSVEELIMVREYIELAKKQLRERGHYYDESIPLGIMIEVPSLLYVLPEISQYCDFFSIGTNDLLQFTFAIDRGNAFVGNMYSYYQPAFLRILRDILYQAHTLNKEISLCGEMASFEKTVPILLGAGLRNFSVSQSQLVKTIKSVISFPMHDSRTLLEDVLRCHTKEQVEKTIEEFYIAYNNNNR